MVAPHELKNKEFTKVMRGYNIAEVDDHIDFIIAQYTELYRQNAELEQKLMNIQSRMSELQGNEESINGALVDAQKTAQKTIREAEAQAEIVMRAAKTNCDKLVAQFKVDIEQQRSELNTLRAAVREFKATMFEAYRTHIEYLEQVSPGEVEDDTEDYTRVVVGMIKDDIVSAAEAAEAEAEAQAEDEYAEENTADAEFAEDNDIAAAPDELPTGDALPEAPVYAAYDEDTPIDQLPTGEEADAVYDNNAQYFDENAQQYDEDAQFADENAQQYDEDAQFADENAQQYDDNAQFADENVQQYDDNVQYAADENSQYIEAQQMGDIRYAPAVQDDNAQYIDAQYNGGQQEAEQPIYSRQSQPIQRQSRFAAPQASLGERRSRLTAQPAPARQMQPMQEQQPMQSAPTAQPAPAAAQPRSRTQRTSVKDAIRQLNQTFVTEDDDDDDMIAQPAQNNAAQYRNGANQQYKNRR